VRVILFGIINAIKLEFKLGTVVDRKTSFLKYSKFVRNIYFKYPYLVLDVTIEHLELVKYKVQSWMKYGGFLKELFPCYLIRI